MSDLTGGRAVVELLKAEQVRYIFGIVGATFLDVLDALYDDRAVEYINVRHEQAAAFMADGLARVTGTPGVCLVTSGPGATNLLTGVAAAYVAHSPVVVLVGGIASEHYGKDAFQEFDLVGMFRPVTKLARADHRGRPHSRAAPRGPARGHERPARARLRRDPARRAERARLPAVGGVSAGELSGHPCPQPPNPEAIRAGRAPGRARPSGPCCWSAAARTGPAPPMSSCASSEPGLDPDDHRVWPERRRAQCASALRGPPRPRGIARGRRRVPAGGSAPGRRLAARPVHDALRRSLHPARDADRADRRRTAGDIGRYYPVAVGIEADAREACLALSEALGREGARAGVAGVAAGSGGAARAAPGAARRPTRASTPTR